MANKNPEQTADISKATALYAFNLSCMIQAEEGAGLSGVEVATIIKSISLRVSPAFSIALNRAIHPNYSWGDCLLQFFFLLHQDSLLSTMRMYLILSLNTRLCRSYQERKNLCQKFLNF